MKTLLMVLAVLLAGCIDKGHGEKVGSVVKLGYDGSMFGWCKTWEGQIMRGGMANGSGVQGASFDFTVEENNPALLEKVKHYMATQQEVKITYRMESFALCQSTTNHFLVDIVPMDDASARPMKLDTTTPIAVEVTPTGDTPKESRKDKIRRLIKAQREAESALLTELLEKE